MGRGIPEQRIWAFWKNLLSTYSRVNRRFNELSPLKRHTLVLARSSGESVWNGHALDGWIRLAHLMHR